MKWIKRVSIAVAALLVVAVALSFLINLDSYIPQIEKVASDKLKEPVSIKSIRFSALPAPHVTIDGITVGKTGDVSVGMVRITPALFSLLSSTKVIKRIEIDSLVVTQKGVDKIPVWSKPDASVPAGGTPQFRVESVRLDNAVVSIDKANFGPFDARVALSDKGEPEQASISTRDGKLKVVITPEQAKYTVEVNAKSWTAPMTPPVVFDELTIKGVATLKDADFSEISAKLYGGAVSGKATAAWQKGMQVNGTLDVNHVEVKDIASVLSPKTHVSGKLSAKPVFSANAAEAGQLMSVLRLDTPFSVDSGIIHGVDIQKAATSVITRAPAGGETRFDQLSGSVSLDHGSYRFTNLKVISGALGVDGNVNISAKKELSGRVNAQIKALGASTSVPLNVGGTLDTPLLYPTGATLGGAAVGTALLGPGLGTTVGAKAGGFVEGLFGKKDDKTPKK